MKLKTNNILKFSFCILLAALITTSCKDKNDEISAFKLEKEEITIGESGGEEEILVVSNQEWVAQASEPWLMISPANGIGETECVVKIDSSLVNDMRTATIRFTPNGQESKTLTVRQTGYNKMIVVENSNIDIESSGITDKRIFTSKITSNVKFDIKIEYADATNEWIEMPKYKFELDREARPRTVNIQFNWKMNPKPEQRIAKINFIPSDATVILKEPATINVTQHAAPKIEDTLAGDSLALLIISEQLRDMSGWNPSEKTQNWKGIVLWEKNDKDLPSEKAVGRVRSAQFFMFNTKESIPQEVRHLKYAEKLSFFSNTNTMFLNIKLGNEICELKHLKNLDISSYGLISLPDDFVKLGNKLEVLRLDGNNFTTFPAIISKANFPKLKTLSITGNRRWSTSDLRKAGNFAEGIGMHFHTSKDNSLRKLLLWDTLEELRLSFNYIEGSFPDFKAGEEGVKAYSQQDVNAFGGDTIQWLADNAIPKILPNLKMLSINLNFFTGNLPDWLRYHPRLIEWYPEILIFNQMENGFDSNGKVVKFDNEPKNFEYYFEAFPKYRKKYELTEENNDKKR